LIGQTLGHYRITAAIGAGGMGEVYRATDTTLKREVAIKVLPPVLAKDTRRLARFRQEARILAAFRHPNIAVVHGLEEVEGKPFLILELVEGQDLSERLKQGPIPLNEALEIGRQIGVALEAAHDQGIVHRDLKPANVKLTPEGAVKVLDFGLAKAYSAGAITSGPAAWSPASGSDTTKTMEGTVMGTAAYMSPEQARGKALLGRDGDRCRGGGGHRESRLGEAAAADPPGRAAAAPPLPEKGPPRAPPRHRLRSARATGGPGGRGRPTAR
jgi:serine/threonine protein kinase